jgi:hypothetical protein
LEGLKRTACFAQMEAIGYRNLQYRPQEAENKHYLTR